MARTERTRRASAPVRLSSQTGRGAGVRRTAGPAGPGRRSGAGFPYERIIRSTSRSAVRASAGSDLWSTQLASSARTELKNDGSRPARSTSRLKMRSNCRR